VAKPKTGYILRSDIRRVECPKCGALPGAFCTTFDKREHQERTTVAVTKDPPTKSAGTDEARSQSQPALVSATPSVPAIETVSVPDILNEQFPSAAPDPLTDKRMSAALLKFDKAVEATLIARGAVQQRHVLPEVAVVDPSALAGGYADDDDGASFEKYTKTLRTPRKRVRVDWHRGTTVTTWYGFIAHLNDYSPRVEIQVNEDDGGFVSLLVGGNDSIVITDCPL
jgi:hypothetical protein